MISRGGATTFVAPALTAGVKGLITLEGGRESHLGIVSREFGIPCVMSVTFTEGVTTDQGETVPADGTILRLDTARCRRPTVLRQRGVMGAAEDFAKYLEHVPGRGAGRPRRRPRDAQAARYPDHGHHRRGRPRDYAQPTTRSTAGRPTWPGTCGSCRQPRHRGRVRPDPPPGVRDDLLRADVGDVPASCCGSSPRGRRRRASSSSGCTARARSSPPRSTPPATTAPRCARWSGRGIAVNLGLEKATNRREDVETRRSSSAGGSSTACGAAGCGFVSGRGFNNGLPEPTTSTSSGSWPRPRPRLEDPELRKAVPEVQRRHRAVRLPHALRLPGRHVRHRPLPGARRRFMIVRDHQLYEPPSPGATWARGCRGA